MILAYNGTCWDHCPSPYILNVYNGLKFCELPCPVTEYYMTDSKDCSETCENVFHKADETGPYKKCDPFISTAGLIEIKTQEEEVKFLTLARQMNYMRFLDIGMPERLERLAANHRRGIFATNFGLEMKSTGNFEFYQEKYPFIYGRIAGVETGLWVSYWQDLISLLIGIGAAIFLFILEKISLGEGWELVELISRRVRVILMWNYVLIVFAWSSDNLILFVAMSAMTLSKQEKAPALTPVSMLLAGLCLCILIAFVFGTFKLIQKRRNLIKMNGIGNLKKAENLKQFDCQYEKFQVLYRGFKDNNRWNQGFFLIYMLRMALPMVITIVAVKSPVAVSVSQMLINLAILGYLLIMKPFKKGIHQIQLVSYETIIFMMNICVIALAAGKSPESTSHIRLGNVIVVGNYMINSLQVVFLVAKLWIEGKIIHQNLKGYDQFLLKEKVIIYLQLFALVIQQDNIGFEEMVSPPPYIFTKRKLPPKPSLPKKKMNNYQKKASHVNEKEYASAATTGTGEGKFLTRDFSTVNLETYREDFVLESDRPLSVFHSHRTPVFQQENDIIIAERSRPVDLDIIIADRSRPADLRNTHKEIGVLLEKAKALLNKKEKNIEEIVINNDSPKLVRKKKKVTSLFAKKTNDDFLPDDDDVDVKEATPEEIVINNDSPRIGRKKRITSGSVKGTNDDDLLPENEIVLEEANSYFFSVKETNNDFLPENQIVLEEQAKPMKIQEIFNEVEIHSSPTMGRKKRIISLYGRETNDNFLQTNEIILEESNSYLSVKETDLDNPEEAKDLNLGRKKRILNKFDIQLEKSNFPPNEL